MRAGTLLDAVRRASARERALARITAAMTGAGVLAAAAAGAVWLFGDGRWLALPRYLPLAAVVFAVAAAGTTIAIAWLRGRTAVELTRLARAVETERGLRRGSLSGLLEIGATPLSARAESRLSAAVAAERLAPARARRLRRLTLVATSALLLAIIAFGATSTRHAEALEVLLHPLRAARGDLLPRLRFASTATALPRGAALNLVVLAPGRSSIRIRSREPGSGWRETVHSVADGRAHLELGPLRQTTMLLASDGRSSSDTLVINAADNPFITNLTLEALYPAVLRRQPEPLPATGQILLPEGSSIRVRGRSSVRLASAALQGPASRGELSVSGAVFTGTVVVRESGEYSWKFSGASAEPVDSPPPLHVSLIADHPPELEIVSPRSDTTVSGDQGVLVAIRASDDHELSSVVVHLRQRDASRVIPLAIPPAGGSASLAIDLSSAAAGSRVTIVATATESGGLGRSTTASRVISVMTADQQREAARATGDSAAALAAGLAAGQQQAERRASEIARSRGDRADRGDDPSAGHALASRARALVEEQQALATRADSLASSTRALESRLSRAGALDDGLAARIAEVRSLLQRALTPALAARLRDAEQAARDGAEEPLRRALGDVAREQRRAREQLERIVEMLRRAAIEGSLETLRAEATDLAQRSDVGAQDAQRLQQSISGVVDRMTAASARAGLPPAQRARTNAGDAASALGRPTSRGSAANALERTARDLAEARSAQIAEWKQELAADIDAAVHELMQLAAAEESLARRVAGGAGDWRREHAPLEEAAAAVASRVTAAARSSTLVSGRSDGLVRAARDGVARVSAPSFPPRDRTQSSALMREAAGSLARAAASLVRDRERTNSARSASGFTELLEELQRLASQQRGLNAAGAGLPLELLGSNAAGAREQARTLARQQRAIARALEEIGDAEGGGRAQPLAAEANRIADALERALVDGSVIARQQRLYHRLLEGGRLLTGDAGEEEEKREAVSATTADAAESVRGENSGRTRRHLPPGWMELRTLTPAERQLVVEYFERLNAGR